MRSNNIKTEMQAALPPLVMDALVQTDVVSRENEACQTEKSTGIDCEVQANPERRTLCAQTVLSKDEIALPEKKRKLSSVRITIFEFLLTCFSEKY